MHFTNIPATSVSIESLREFAVFSQSCSISKAAKLLHCSQPTLSKHLIALEKAVGVSLIRREGRSLSLTPAGEAFLGDQCMILHNYAVSVENARMIQENRTVEIRIFEPLYEDVYAHALFESVINLAHSSDAAIKYSLVAANDEGLIDCLQHDTADIGIMYSFGDELPAVSADDIDIYPLGLESLVVWGSNENPLYQKDYVRIIDLTKQNMVMIENPAYVAYADMVNGFFAAHSLYSNNIIAKANSFSDFLLRDSSDSTFLLPKCALNDSRIAKRRNTSWKDVENSKAVQVSLYVSRRIQEFSKAIVDDVTAQM